MRVRFHGRGGQGMKTASRILGSAAFHAGLVVQDSPVYGAERRGAPVAAFTRIAKAAIRERGLIAAPDLIVVADETLLFEPTAMPLAGCSARTVVLINTATDAAALQERLAHLGRIESADFTSLVFSITHTLVGLSTALGVAAAALVGLSLEESLAGVAEELAHATLSRAAYEANERLAQEAYALADAWRAVPEPLDASLALAAEAAPTALLAAAPAGAPGTQLVELRFEPPARATPTICVANTPERSTGSWRQFRPLLQRDLCNACWTCFVLCPEGAIALDEHEFPLIDYEVCKGCLVCVHECPTHAFATEKEVR